MTDGKDTTEKSENVNEAPSAPLPSEEKTPVSLKPKPKISKKVKNNKRKKNSKNNLQRLVKGIEEEKGISDDPQTFLEMESEDKNKPNNTPNGVQSSGLKQNKRLKEKGFRLQKNPKNQMAKRKLSGPRKILKSQTSKMQSGSKPGETQTGNLGGLIFMCNAKTKPDCFRYRVMGVPLGKKDVLLNVKPGVLLFLFDYEMRLMYGIYKASSAGSMRLEPAAFQGAFPAQVRFSIHKECCPLPESKFKRVIEENYHGSQRFSTELTAIQVKKLKKLFLRGQIRQGALPSGFSPGLTIPERGLHEQVRGPVPLLQPRAYAGGVHGGVPLVRDERRELLQRGPMPLSQTEAYAGGVRGDGRIGSYRDERSAQRELMYSSVPTAPERYPTAPSNAIHHDPRFLTERSYGAHRLSPPFSAAAPPALRPHQLDWYYSGNERRDSLSTAPPPPLGSHQLDSYGRRDSLLGGGPPPMTIQTDYDSRYGGGYGRVVESRAGPYFQATRGEIPPGAAARELIYAPNDLDYPPRPHLVSAPPRYY